MTALASISVLVPLLSAVVAFVRPRLGPTAALAASVAAAASGLAAAVALQETAPIRIALGGWEAPLGIEWRIDGLAVVMLTTVGVVAAAVSVYARGYFLGQSDAQRDFWPLFLMLLAGMNALILSSDLFNLYVTLEIVGLSAVALVTLSRSPSADAAAFRYLLVSLLGSLLYLAGVALIYRNYSTLDLAELETLVESTLSTWTALALMISGLLLKSAIFPLSFWLAPAHSSAPAPVSALLSALVVKGSFLILVRLWQQVVPSSGLEPLALVMGIAGAGAILWGSICALRTERLKLLVAYSTVAQLGYLTFLSR